MAGSLNKLMLIGNVTREPETRYVSGGTKQVTKFILAVNERSKGESVPMFIDVNVWDKLAEIVNTYVKKGASVYVEGKLVIRKYDDKDGNKRTAVECTANTVTMLDKRSDSAGSGGSYGGGGNSGSRSSSSSADEAALDDEIPFLSDPREDVTSW